jgi:phosphoribosylanthranilate isomerase
MITLKVCGLTTLREARACVAAGAHALGVSLESAAPGSPALALAASIVDALGDRCLVVGVVGPDRDDDELARLKQETGVACLQFEGRLAPERLARYLPHAYLSLPLAAFGPACEPPPGDYVMARVEARSAENDEAAWQGLRAIAATKRLALSAPFTLASARETLARLRPFCLDLRPSPADPGPFDRRRVEALLALLSEASLTKP